MTVDAIYILLKVNHGDNRILGVYGNYENAEVAQEEAQAEADREGYGDFIHINSHRLEDAEDED